MSQTDYSELFAEMSSGPAVLLMGQDVLRQYAGEDLFLSTCQKRFDLDLAENYDDLISGCGDASSVMGIWHDINIRREPYLDMHLTVSTVHTKGRSQVLVKVKVFWQIEREFRYLGIFNTVYFPVANFLVLRRAADQVQRTAVVSQAVRIDIVSNRLGGA